MRKLFFPVSNCVSALFMRKEKIPLLFFCVVLLSSCVETLDLSSPSSGWGGGSSSSASARDGRSIGRVVHVDIAAETLLEEDGVWNLVEQSKSYDPAQAHLEARKRVDTKRRATDKSLSAHFQPDAKSGQDGKIRLLRLDTGDDGYDIYKDIEIAESTLIKPANAVAGSEQLKQITDVFGVAGGLKVKHQVVPARKPLLKDTIAKQALERDVKGAKAHRAAAKSIMGVIVPPALPLRKRAVQASSSVGAQKTSNVTAVAYDLIPRDIIVPSRKPVPRAVAAVQSSSAVENGGALAHGQLSYVNKLRAGIYKGKARLVIETKNATRYKAAVDHLRKVLRVKLEQARLNVKGKGSLAHANALFGTYIASEKADGSVYIEVRLKNKSQIVDTMILRPNVSANHRIVIDLGQ